LEVNNFTLFSSKINSSSISSQETNKKLAKSDPSQSAVINQLQHVLLKPKKVPVNALNLFLI
jgi:hypothetical protein